jgi:hypothetical protein
MKNSNSEILELIHRQARVLLLHFEEELNKRGYLLLTLSQFEIVFKNSDAELIRFYFSNDYRHGVGLQPLQDITTQTSQREVRLSTEVEEREYKGAFRNHFNNRAPGQTRTSIFKDLALKYLLNTQNI